MFGAVLVLMVIAAGLGIFVASLGATLRRSYDDRARFVAGADLRISGNPEDIADVVAALQKESGRGSESLLIYRTSAALAASSISGGITLVATDPSQVQQFLSFRDDFSEEPLDNLLFSLRAPQRRGPERELPGKPVKIGVWVNIDEPRKDLALGIRLRDSEGRYITALLGVLDHEDWSYLETELASPSGGRVPAYPVKFNSLFLIGDRFSSIGPTGRVLLDDLTVTFADQNTQVVEEFNDAEDFEPIRIPAFLQDSIGIHPEGLNGPGLAVSWFTPISNFPRGFFQRDVDIPVSAIVSENFLALPAVRTGQEVLLNVEGRTLPIVIQGTFKLFPTTDPRFERVVVVSLDKLQQYFLAIPGSVRGYPNEIWVSHLSKGEAERLAAQIEDFPSPTLRVVSREGVASSFQSDPLAAAGWSVLPYVVYGIVLTLIASIFAIYLAYVLRKRRLEHAVFSALGISKTHLVQLSVVEHILLCFGAVSLGLLWGLRVRSDVIRFLDTTELGTPVIPPFQGDVHWEGVGLFYGGLFLVTVLFSLVAAICLYAQDARPALRSAE
jgi:hypothetical protein